MLARFCKFYESVKNSKSMEVRLVASLAVGDIRTPTGSNCQGIRREFNMQAGSMVLMRGKILDAKRSVPGQDCWRLPCLRKFLNQRYQLEASLKDTMEIDLLIESICSS